MLLRVGGPPAEVGNLPEQTDCGSVLAFHIHAAYIIGLGQNLMKRVSLSPYFLFAGNLRKCQKILLSRQKEQENSGGKAFIGLFNERLYYFRKHNKMPMSEKIKQVRLDELHPFPSHRVCE